MQAFYSTIQNFLPFEWASYNFMSNALLAILIIAPVFGLIGTMVVNNQMAFFSDALGHSALTGVAIGVMLGFRDPVVSAVMFAILFAVAISEVKSVGNCSADTIISVFSSAALAVGIALLSKNGNFSKYNSYLIGDLLSVTPDELLTLLCTLAAILLIWYLIYKHLILISLNRSLAKSRGIRVRLVENIFIILVAVLVTVSVSRVGILIINSMLILPAAASRNIAKNVKSYMSFAVIISVICGISGLISSFYLNTSAGATIILFMAAVFFISLVISIFGKRRGI